MIFFFIIGRFWTSWLSRRTRSCRWTGS